MAKTLKDGETYTDNNGDVWSEAVLHVDYTYEDWLTQIMTMTVCIYKDTAARAAGYAPLKRNIAVSKAAFLENFTLTEAISTLKSQCETYALTLIDPVTGNLYSDLFE
ncbi:MAG: hypothetical protein JRJ00_00235 [Deltaproteobacteria bacterium]|nr:hypothetical protein [Deltaproteobacteria bacterium]